MAKARVYGFRLTEHELARLRELAQQTQRTPSAVLRLLLAQASATGSGAIVVQGDQAKAARA